MAEKKHRVNYEVNAQDKTKAAFESVKKSLEEIELSAVGLETTLGALSIGIVAAGFVEMGHKVLEAEDALNKLSQKSGAGVEWLSTMRYAADLSDVSMDELGKGLKKLSVNMLDTQAETGDAKEAFKALGIEVEDSRGHLKSSEEVFTEIAAKFGSMEDGAGKTALAVKLFGKSGADLIPLLNAGADGLSRMTGEAERLGLKLDKETTEAAERFNDNLRTLSLASKGAAQAMVNPLLPALNDVAEAMKRGALEGGAMRGVLLGLREATIQAFGGNVRSQLADTNDEIEKTGNLLRNAEERIKKGALNQGQVEALSNKLSALYGKQSKLQTLLEFDTPGGLRDGSPETPKDKAPRLPSKDGKSKDDSAKRLAEAERIARLQAEEEERWAKEASEAWNFVPLLQQRLAEIERMEAIFGDDTGMSIADLQTKLKLTLEGIDALADIEDRAARVAAGFNEEGTEYIGTIKKMDDGWKELGLTFESAFEGAVLGGKKFRDVLQGIAQDIARMILRKGVTEPLGNAIMGSGLFGSFGSFFSGLFGGGGGLGGGTSYGIATAEGGPRWAGQPLMVGEQGPELFVPGAHGYMVPNHKLGMGGGGDTINVHFNYALGLGPSIRAEVVGMMPQIRRDVLGAVLDARKRNLLPA